MTKDEAEKILSGPLAFGDERQIKARKLLERLAAEAEAAALSDADNDDDCETCCGEGTHECRCGDEHECGDCDGKGTTP